MSDVVHLVADVRRLANGLEEDPAVLDDRRVDARVAVARGARSDDRLQCVEPGGFLGEQVPHAARGLIRGHGTLTISSFSIGREGQ